MNFPLKDVKEAFRDPVSARETAVALASFCVEYPGVLEVDVEFRDEITNVLRRDWDGQIIQCVLNLMREFFRCDDLISVFVDERFVNSLVDAVLKRIHCA
ncbi:hypothetical protein BASA62_004617 [Batrachochytrium salamandrivorans]|nr:hypothetical protein BASA62_004617 [Batrachochytrium salamandrivorans]